MHLVSLAPLGGVFVLTGLAFVEPLLDRGLVDGHARRTAVHDAAERTPVAFAERRDDEQRSETVT